jgi:hypothetical protein
LGTALNGAIHGLVDEWALDLGEGEVVRLYLEEAGKLTALVAGLERVRLLFFDLEGNRLEEQVLLVNPFADDPLFGVAWSPARAVSTARLADGRRLLSFASARSGVLGLLEFDAAGAMRWRDEEIFAGEWFDLVALKERFNVEDDSLWGHWGLSVYNQIETQLTVASNAQASAFITVPTP